MQAKPIPTRPTPCVNSVMCASQHYDQLISIDRDTLISLCFGYLLHTKGENWGSNLGDE